MTTRIEKKSTETSEESQCNENREYRWVREKPNSILKRTNNGDDFSAVDIVFPFRRLRQIHTFKRNLLNHGCELAVS